MKSKSDKTNKAEKKNSNGPAKNAPVKSSSNHKKKSDDAAAAF